MLLIVLFIFIAICSFPRKDIDIGVRCCLVAFSSISIILSYRASDFPTYKNFYDGIEPFYSVLLGENQFFFKNNDDFEIGYTLLNSLFKVVSPFVEIMYVCCSFSMLYVIYYFLRDKSQNFFKLFLPYFTFLFITVQVGIIRQALAISIFYFAILYLQRKNFFKYLTCVIFASLFHSTAILLIPFYFIVNRSFSSKTLSIILFVGIMIFIGIFPFKFIDFFEYIAEFLFPQIGSKLSFYVFESKQLDMPSRFNLGIFENVILFLVLIEIRRLLVVESKWGSFLNISFNFAMVYIFFYIYFFEFFNVIYRINYYFILFKFFPIVAYIENVKNSKRRIVYHCVLVSYCAVMLIMRIMQGF